MRKALVFLYGVVCYLVFFLTFLYAIGFVGNLLVPKGIDTGAPEPFSTALPVNLLLLGIFALQHSIMARPGFKKGWTRIVPPPIERSTYVLLSSLALILLFWQWRPMLSSIWEVSVPAARSLFFAVFAAGWLLALLSTFLIDHFDLFGLRQAYCYASGKRYIPPPFTNNGLYRYVRHPIMLGFVIAFWATPRMTAGHLLFSLATTAYILIGITLEERDLLASLGEAYRKYRSQTSMLIPGRYRRRSNRHAGG